ncbi:hypothetical protein RMSM_00393 [Rhodopirellula maiorica SM1]|uniref:Uncharacterized protein n=1 Tax=Rhodopirellula maiorica SM1 TaxID=1265738 RepID=M5RTQ5_9BACT|nr:hypothetical protein RMSM_00393 [Rhodopirellula maiorica SM1]
MVCFGMNDFTKDASPIDASFLFLCSILDQGSKHHSVCSGFSTSGWGSIRYRICSRSALFVSNGIDSLSPS